MAAQIAQANNIDKPLPSLVAMRSLVIRKRTTDPPTLTLCIKDTCLNQAPSLPLKQRSHLRRSSNYQKATLSMIYLDKTFVLFVSVFSRGKCFLKLLQQKRYNHKLWPFKYTSLLSNWRIQATSTTWIQHISRPALVVFFILIPSEHDSIIMSSFFPLIELT